MSSEISQAISDAFSQAKRVLIVSHIRPDGDAIGATMGLGLALQAVGKTVQMVLADGLPRSFRFLKGSDQVHHRVKQDFDLSVVLDCSDLLRTGGVLADRQPDINIDHHITGVEFAQLNWIDHSAASVGEMVYQLARAAGVAVTPQMAQCLYTTILTDTGGFCYGNVRESTFALARELVQAGADPIAIAQQVYFSAPASKLLLLGAALRRLKREGCLAWLWVTHQDTQRACATEEDCEGIVNVVLGMAGVDTGVFLRELPDGSIRLSLRSKGRLNVAAIAARLGGGGHQNAAGCTLEGPLPRALEEILSELRGAL